MNAMEVIGTIVVIGLLFGLAVITFDGLNVIQTPNSTAYNTTEQIRDAASEYGGIYNPLVWIGIFVVIITFIFMIVKQMQNGSSGF